MKIVFIAGANSIHSWKWINYFKEKGHQVFWFSLPLTDIKETTGLTPQIIGENPFLAILKIYRAIKKIKPDIVHAHYAGINGLIGALVNYHPFIVTAWGSDILLAGQDKIKGLFVKYALKKADLITCDAGHMKSQMIKMGVPADKIKIVYFGIDTEKFKPQIRTIKKGKVIISLRSLEPVYDIETLIKTFPLVSERVPGVEFLIYGKGSQEDYLKKLAVKVGGEGKIHFMGQVENNQLPDILNAADVYISTSLSDAGISASTAEAMACGLPVIVTDSGENRKWIKDGESGFVIPVKSERLVADKIVYLIERKDERKRIGETARRVIVENNDYKNEMEKMDNLYCKLIGQWKT